MASIPQSYGQDRLVLMVKNPNWLHTYWEITEDMRAAHEGELYLRTHGFTPDHYFFDLKVSWESRNWYIDVNRPDTTFYTELGTFKGGEFQAFLRSNEVHTPRNRVSDVVDQNWLSLREIYTRSRSMQRGPASPDFIEELDFARDLAEASPAMAEREES